MTLASAVFGFVGTLLTTIRVRLLFCNGELGFTYIQDSAANKSYVELGLACADVCRALDRGTIGKNPDELSQSVCKAIGQLTTWVEPVTRRWKAHSYS